MASYTNNYSLAKPDYTDEADIKIINNNTDTIDNLIHQNRSMISDSYDSTKTYSVGDVVIYEGTLYKCITDVVAAESFDKTKWEKTTAVESATNKTAKSLILQSSSDGSTKQFRIAVDDTGAITATEITAE